jgi:dihydroorotase
MSLARLLAALSSHPADLLRLPQGRLARGAPADLILFDPDEPFVLDPADLHSLCRNTAFDGARLQGVVHMSMVAGRIVHRPEPLA